MNVLLSIKPKYVNSIIEGNKKYEFRKQIFTKKTAVKLIFIYASAPVKKIIGFFTIDKIIEDHPNKLWQNLSQSSGMDKEDFFDYFKDRDLGYAIKIKKFHPFLEPLDPTKIIQNFKPPQSFYYIHNMGDLESLIE